MPRGRTAYDHAQDQAGQRPCSRQPPELCESARTVTDPADGSTRREPGLTPRPFCEPCQARIITCLRELPAAYRGLAAQIGDPARTGTAIRRPPGSRVLLNPEIDALLRLTAGILAGWAARVRSVPGLQLADPEHQHDTPAGVEEACATLARHATPLLALQPGWMTRLFTFPFDAPIPPELEDEIGDEEIVGAGDGWVKVTTRRDGTDAGNEILALHWRARKLLGWTKPAPESFDGVPCQNCDEMALERAEPPSNPDIPADHSRCAACEHTMSREVFDQWAERYAAWARGAGVQECRRCSLGNHQECSWSACSCAEGEHPRRRAAALPERYLTCRGVQGIMTEGEVSPERVTRPGLCHFQGAVIMRPGRADGLLTTAEAARLAGVSVNTIYSWRNRGHLVPQGLDERGRPLHTREAVRAAERLVRENGIEASGIDPRQLRQRPAALPLAA